MGQCELFTTHGLASIVLPVRVKDYEQGDHQLNYVMAFKASITGLQRDLEKVKSTNISILWINIEIPQGVTSNMSTKSQILLTLVTGDASLVDYGNDSGTPDKNKEELAAPEDALYGVFEDLEGEMACMVTEIS